MGIWLEDWGARTKAVRGLKIVNSLAKVHIFSCTLLSEFLYIFAHGVFDVDFLR